MRQRKRLRLASNAAHWRRVSATYSGHGVNLKLSVTLTENLQIMLCVQMLARSQFAAMKLPREASPKFRRATDDVAQTPTHLYRVLLQIWPRACLRPALLAKGESAKADVEQPNCRGLSLRAARTCECRGDFHAGVDASKLPELSFPGVQPIQRVQSQVERCLHGWPFVYTGERAAKASNMCSIILTAR